MDSQEVIVRKAKNPLLISPNLDALLEHDERTRPRVNVPKSPVLPASASTPSSAGSFVGLPPPPRGPRRTVVKSAEKVGEKLSPRSPFLIDTSVPEVSTGGIATGSASGATSNPFINPAPSLEILLREEVIKPPPRSSSTGANNKVLSLPDNANDSKDGHVVKKSKTEERHDPRPHTIPLSNDGRRKRSRRAHQQASLSHQKTSPALSRTQQGKEVLGNLSDSSASNQNSRRTKNSVNESQDRTATARRERAKAKNRGRLALKDVSVQGVVDKEIRSSPLFSHGDDTSSSINSSDTTHGPSSTAPDELRTPSTTYQPSTHPPRHANTPTTMDSSRQSNDGHHLQRRSRESFIELSSPTKLEHNFSDLQSTDAERLHTSPPQLKEPNYPVEASKLPKPPLPTTPKPQFGRSPPGQSAHPKKPDRHASPLTREQTNTERLDPHFLPLTTNFLSSEERAELVKRNRKLAKVFGKTLGAETLAQQRKPTHLHVPHSKSSHHRNAHSIDAPVVRQQSVQSQTESTVYTNVSGRRHSTPEDVSSLSLYSFEEGEPALNIEFGSEEDVPPRESSRRRNANRERQSVTSFIDLSDGDFLDFNIGSERGKRRAVPKATPSLFENMTQDEQADEERRRKREKLAKLHRFLGSHVPTDLALGIPHFETPLPAPLPRDSLLTTLGSVTEVDNHIPFLRRRRSSSVVALPTTWSDDIERLKEELDNREKAVNVRRAVKMEKVFGVQPPQTLFHTRNSPSPSLPPGSGPSTPTFLARAAGLNPSVDISSFSLRKDQPTPKPKEKQSRYETSDTNQQLLPYPSSIDYDFTMPLISSSKRHSDMYSHYQHSLNSLHDILDRDDKQSLAELHEYLNDELPQVVASTTPQYTNEHSMSAIKAERRRSLPARTSMVSISSMLTVTPKPEVSDFQLRRRRAAKLAHFFGVDYRDLIKDVLESIEKGVDDERKKGTLDHDEAEDLMQKLRNLRNKRATTS